MFLSLLPENIPDEKMKEHSGQNWNKLLGDLKQLLENQDVRREKLLPEYKISGTLKLELR